VYSDINEDGLPDAVYLKVSGRPWESIVEANEGSPVANDPYTAGILVGTNEEIPDPCGSGGSGSASSGDRAEFGSTPNRDNGVEFDAVKYYYRLNTSHVNDEGALEVSFGEEEVLIDAFFWRYSEELDSVPILVNLDQRGWKEVVVTERRFLPAAGADGQVENAIERTFHTVWSIGEGGKMLSSLEEGSFIDVERALYRPGSRGCEAGTGTLSGPLANSDERPASAVFAVDLGPRAH